MEEIVEVAKNVRSRGNVKLTAWWCELKFLASWTMRSFVAWG
jgi:hypothetical protein